jgi:glycosyltransferase involved in cell wall biosynthesis
VPQLRRIYGSGRKIPGCGTALKEDGVKHDTVAILTNAFNAQDTLPATIESVLAQTHENIRYRLFDNASTDNTLRIIKEYAAKDKRIEYSAYSENFNGSFLKSMYGFIDAYRTKQNSVFLRKHEDWVCFVDADDTIHPRYAESLLAFASENGLDMAACGWDFVRPDRTDHRKPEKNAILMKSEYSGKLPEYDKFMGPVWNKIFRFSKLASDVGYYEYKFSRLFRDGVFFYGADTCFIYFFLSRLEKFGLVSDILYNYNIREDSASRRRFHPLRIVADRRLAEVRLDFLQETGFEISPENLDFILNIYFKSSKTTMDLLLSDDRHDLKEKMKYLHEMFAYKLMDEAFSETSAKYL